MVSLLVMGLKKNKLQIWQHVHIFVHEKMIVVHLSILALKKCANFILSVFQTVLHLEIIDFARNVSTTYLTVGVLLGNREGGRILRLGVRKFFFQGMLFSP